MFKRAFEWSFSIAVLVLAKKSGAVTRSFAFLADGVATAFDTCPRFVSRATGRGRELPVPQLRREPTLRLPESLITCRAARSRAAAGYASQQGRSCFPGDGGDGAIPPETHAFKWGASSVSPNDDLCAMMCARADSGFGRVVAFTYDQIPGWYHYWNLPCPSGWLFLCRARWHSDVD